MKIKTNCPLSAGIGCSSSWYLTKAFQELGHELVNENPDLVVNIDGMPHIPKENGAKFFFWDCDSFLHSPTKQTLLFDKLFIGGSPEDLIKYPKGTVFIPHAFDPEFHYKHDIEQEFDIVMIGKKSILYEKRNKTVEDLAKIFSVLHQEVKPGHDYSKAMSRGKLIFNMSLGEKNIPMRFFEGMAIGALLENYNDNLDSLATNGEHYIGYTSFDDLVAKIRYYLDHNTARNKIVRKARKHALKHHTYQHRAKEILKYV